MSRSIQKYPACKVNTRSQKKGKQICHRLFRQRESMAMRTGNMRKLPYYQRQIIDQWDLTDGRLYFGNDPHDEFYYRLMRK